MAYYKILKQGGFSEERLNRVGDVVDLAPVTADPQVKRGFLKPVSTKPTPIKPEALVKPKAEPKAKKKK